MIKRLLLSFAVALPVAATAQTPPQTPPPQAPPRVASAPPAGSLPVDRVVAVVGDQVILWSDVMNSINQQRAAGLQLPPDSASQAILARDALNALVDLKNVFFVNAPLVGSNIHTDAANMAPNTSPSACARRSRTRSTVWPRRSCATAQPASNG